MIHHWQTSKFIALVYSSIILLSVLLPACSWVWWADNNGKQSEPLASESGDVEDESNQDMASMQFMVSASLEKDGSTTISGVEFPQAAVYAPHHQKYFISNLGFKTPGFLAEDMPNNNLPKSFISRLSDDGQLDILDFIIGLEAAKGMATSREFLYVADQNYVKVYDIVTGGKRWELNLASLGITEIECLVLVDDILYASAPSESKIVEITLSTQTAKDFIKVENLRGFAWSPLTQKFLVISNQSGVYFDHSGKMLQEVSLETNDPSYVLYDAAGNLYLADMATGMVIKQDAYKIVHTIAENLGQPGQLGIGHGIVVIPCPTKHQLRLVRIP